MLHFFVSFEYLAGLGGLAVTSSVLDTSDVIDFFDQEKSSFISELIEGNEEISINLLNILMEQQLPIIPRIIISISIIKYFISITIL